MLPCMIAVPAFFAARFDWLSIWYCWIKDGFLLTRIWTLVVIGLPGGWLRNLLMSMRRSLWNEACGLIDFFAGV